jgi:hypothetical protein
MSLTGQRYCFANANRSKTWEYKMGCIIPELEHLQLAVASLLSSQEPPVEMPRDVEIKATLGLPRVEGIVDIVRGHPAFTNRSSNCMQLQDVSYKGVYARGGQDVDCVFYGNVIAMGSAAGIDFVFVRNYSTPTDSRGKPCTLQPLVWEEPARPKSKGQAAQEVDKCGKKPRVTTVPGVYTALSLDMLYTKICIVPDYKRGVGNFLVNDLVG